MRVPLNGELLETPGAVEPYREEWDRLAVAAERPFSSPAWALAWWRHSRSRRSALRVVAVRASDGGLAGIAPLGVERRHGLGRYRFLGAEAGARIEPLARPGAEAEVAAAVASILARADPRLDLLHFVRIPAESPWPALIAESWPGTRRARVEVSEVVSAPVVTLGAGSFEEWMGEKSSNFRQQMRRGRRQLEASGASFRTAERSDLDRAVAGLCRLHQARWAGRGGSDALEPGADEALLAAGCELLESDRFRLEGIEVDGELVSSHLFVAAGGEVSYWLGGFDERFAAQRPAMVALVAAVEEGLKRRDRRLDLGPGAQDYKYRLADAEDRLHDVTLVPRSSRYPVARLMLAAAAVRRRAGRRLSRR